METYCKNCGADMDYGYQYIDRICGSDEEIYVDICPACANEMAHLFEAHGVTLRSVNYNNANNQAKADVLC